MSIPDSNKVGDASRVIISVNPNSGASDQRALAETLDRLLLERGVKAELLTDIDAVSARVNELVAEGNLRAVVAAGGDGTIGLLVNRLPPKTPFALLPLGTENLLAKYLHQTSAPEQVAETILNGRMIQLDVGKANEKLFLVMASCGFDADVVHRLHKNRSGHIRHWSYAKPIVNAIRKYRYPTIRVTVGDDDKPSVKSKWAFVFNVPRYAMNLPIVEDADAMDGQLDICTFRGGNLARGLVYLAGVVFRQHRGWDDTKTRRAKKFLLESDGEVPYQLDGDPGGHLPLQIDVLTGYLNVLVDPEWVAPKASRQFTRQPNAAAYERNH